MGLGLEGSPRPRQDSFSFVTSQLQRPRPQDTRCQPQGQPRLSAPLAAGAWLLGPQPRPVPTCLAAARLLCGRLLFLLLLLPPLPPFSQGLAELSSPQDNVPELGPAQAPTGCTRQPLAFQHGLPSTVPIKMAYFTP